MEVKLEEWKLIGSEHIRVNSSQFENLKIDSETINFLTKYGMPSECGELNFDYLEKEKIKTVNEKFRLDDSSLDKYAAIGFNGSGDPICVNLDNNQIVYLNHDDSFKEVFINSNFSSFVQTIITIQDFIDKFSEYPSSTAWEVLFSKKCFTQLKEDLNKIDDKIMSKSDSHWKYAIESIKWQREEDRKLNAMKRIQLFEIEDQSLFPAWIRDSMTKLINVMHKFLETKKDLSGLLKKVMDKTGKSQIVDLCSGAGGPVIDSVDILKKEIKINLTLTDLYPNKKIATQLNSDSDDSVSYMETPVNAVNVPENLDGIRTMVCSLHHMKPKTVEEILSNAQEAKEGFCAIEISDNSFPKILWWVSIPFTFITCLIITPMAKGLTVQQVIFTYLIPIIPVFFAWDGAVSNARTYTMNDIEIILSKIRKPEYTWEPGVLKGKKAKKMYLIGYPTV